MNDVPMRTLRWPTSEEKERMTRTGYLHGYIAAHRQIIPFEEWKEGEDLFLNTKDEAVRASVARACRRAGIRAPSVVSTDGIYFSHRGKSTEAQKRTNGALYKRDYDRVIPMGQLRYVMERRETPDGVERKVRTTLRSGEQINQFPWSELKDGDYFIVRHDGRMSTMRGLRQTFHSASCRYDFEIQVVDWDVVSEGERFPGFRVTRIQEGLAELKRAGARAQGKVVTPSKGRRVPKVNTKQLTLEKRACEALEKAGLRLTDNDGILAMIERVLGERSKTDARSAFYKRLAGTAEVPAVSGEPESHEHTPQRDAGSDGSDDRSGAETPRAGAPRAEPELLHDADDGGSVDLFEGRLNPEPRQPRIWAPDEVREFSVEGVDPERLTGALDPNYDRAALMRERLKKLGVE